VRLDEEKLTREVAGLRVSAEEVEQAGREGWDGFRPDTHLEADDSTVAFGRVGDEIGEVAVERDEHGVQLLRLSDHV
jgi:hypothetical protein